MSSLENSATASEIDAATVSTELSEVDQQFDALCEQYYHSWFRYNPENAVEVGVYDFAHLLKSYEHDEYGALVALNQKMQSALDELSFAQMSPNRRVDYQIIKGAISIELHDLEENDWRFRDPVQYVPLNAIYQLLIHPGKHVQQAFKDRLDGIPEYLRGAKALIKQYPERIVPQWAKIAIQISSTGADFIRGLEKNQLIKNKFSNPMLLQPLFDSAAFALQDFSQFLETEILPVAEGKFASGNYRFNRLLNEKHFYGVEAEKILGFGERLVDKTQAELLVQSEKVCGEKDIAKALAKVTANHPDAADLLSTYRSRMKKAQEWLESSELVSVPATQSLKVQETPAFLRGVIPFAAYQPPMPFDEQQQGLYYVTTVQDETLLAEHNQYSIDLTSVHEAFPGHHLQFVIANQRHKDNPTRLLNASASMYEGWALYCEQLVIEQGMLNEDEHKFMLLRDRLWRALRIVIDVKLHTGQFTFHDAVELLVELLGFDNSQAESEVSWYCHAAATPLCYAVGREIILLARNEVVGDPSVTDKTALKDFHDQLLAYGSIALPLIIQQEFGDAVWQQIKDRCFADD